MLTFGTSRRLGRSLYLSPDLHRSTVRASRLLRGDPLEQQTCHVKGHMRLPSLQSLVPRDCHAWKRDASQPCLTSSMPEQKQDLLIIQPVRGTAGQPRLSVHQANQTQLLAANYGQLERCPELCQSHTASASPVGTRSLQEAEEVKHGRERTSRRVSVHTPLLRFPWWPVSASWLILRTVSGSIGWPDRRPTVPARS